MEFEFMVFTSICIGLISLFIYYIFTYFLFNILMTSSFFSKSTKFIPYFELAIRKIYLAIENFDISTTGKAEFVIAERKQL